MKPTSVIFLIVSVIVIIVGLALCSAGINTAREQDISLFETDVSVVDDNVIRSDAFSAEEVNKVKMNLDDVSVTISASETGESYLELYNFQVGSYDYSIQNKMLLIDNNTSIFSIMHIAEGNFSFKGLRHYLAYRPNENQEKSVHLYLSSDAATKSFDISCTTGSITIEGLSLAADYGISIESGNVTFKDVTSKATITVSVGEGDVFFDNVSGKKIDVLLEKGNLLSYVRSVTSTMQATVNHGDILFALKGKNLYGYEIALSAAGQLYYNDELLSENPCTLDDGMDYVSISLNAADGDIRTYTGKTASSEEEAGTDTEDETVTDEITE